MRESADANLFDPHEELRLATFAVGNDQLAVDIMRIKEIVRPLPTTPVPKAVPAMVGVVDLRGTIMPLFDLRVRFGVVARTEQELPTVRHMMVALDGRLLGLVVDEVLDVVTVRRSAIRLASTVLTGEATQMFVGVCTVRQTQARPESALTGGGPHSASHANDPSPERVALLLNLRQVVQGAHTISGKDWLAGKNVKLTSGGGQP